MTMNKENFILKSNKTHGDRYYYSKVPQDVKSKEKITIICPEHGEFEQIAYNHMKGSRCKYCIREETSRRCRKTSEKFIKDCKMIHGDKYDYSKVKYKSAHDKVIIICPKHGEFEMKPNAHLNGQGCSKCWLERKGKSNILTTQEFIQISRKVHGDKYDYSKTNYIKDNVEVVITCPVHGDFIQVANYHKHGRGCPECGKITLRQKNIKGKENFILKSKKHHFDRYDYSKVPKNVKVRDKIIIICPDHGEFEQVAYYHMNGNGCPKCNLSKGEFRIINFLENEEIVYEYQKRFHNLNPLYSFDFYLPEYNLIIEFDGIQHFIPCDFSHCSLSEEENLKNLEKVKFRDNQKNEWCKENNIDLLRIPYYEFDNIEDVISEKISKMNRQQLLLKYFFN